MNWIIKYSTIYEGNKADCKTVADMIDRLRLTTSSTDKKALVVIDAGITADQNLEMISIRKCSDPKDKAMPIYDTLNYKYAPFIRKKSVVLKKSPENFMQTKYQHIMRC